MSVVSREAQELARFIRFLPGFHLVHRTGASYGHVGAALADTVLQAGVRYKTVVWPRVDSILKTYPRQSTTSSFWAVVERIGPERVLQWRHPEKPARLVRLFQILLERHIEYVCDLADWLCLPSSRPVLLASRGIGPKTVDYLAGLVGVDVVAVDRHLVNFLGKAGFEYSDYSRAREIVSYAADLMGVTRRDLDHSIWLYQSEGAQFQGSLVGE